MERQTILFFGIVLAMLAVATVAGWILAGWARERDARVGSAVRVLNARLRAWWGTCVIFGVAMLTGGIGSLVVFGLSSFLLLREFVTITPTRRADHHALFLVFFVVLPFQYLALATGWYGFFLTLIPVYAFLIIPMRMAVAGDGIRFLERAAKLQWALMLCVYCISHAPALVHVGGPGGAPEGLRLLLFLLVVVQVSDIAYSVAGMASDRHKLVASLKSDETWEGAAAAFLLGIGTGVAFAWATPFSRPQAAGMALGIVLMALAGRLCLKAIYQDRGREGVVVVHSRPTLMERLVSLCFAAPFFFHLTRYFFGRGPLLGF